MSLDLSRVGFVSFVWAGSLSLHTRPVIYPVWMYFDRMGKIISIPKDRRFFNLVRLLFCIDETGAD